MHVFADVAELMAHGADLGRSQWLVLDQERIHRYTTTAGGTPTGRGSRSAVRRVDDTTIHRYLALALIPLLSQQIWRVQVRFAVNAGLNKIRFGTPIPAGARIQLDSALVSARLLASGALVVINERIFTEHDPEPVVMAETLTLIRS